MKRNSVRFLVLSIVMLSLCLGTYSFRNALWRSPFATARQIASYCYALGGEFNGGKEGELVARLGEPDAKEGPYGLIVVDPEDVMRNRNADLIVKLDSSNRVVDITYLWKDYTLPVTNEFRPERWKLASAEQRASMTGDFLRNWYPMNRVLGDTSFAHLKRDLGNITFVREWRYRLSDWTALVIVFDEDGKVRHTSIGYDD